MAAPTSPAGTYTEPHTGYDEPRHSTSAGAPPNLGGNTGTGTGGGILRGTDTGTGHATGTDTGIGSSTGTGHTAGTGIPHDLEKGE